MKRNLFTSNWRFSAGGAQWENIIVPHDAMLHQERSADAPGGGAQAYFHGGSYVYEKNFEAPEADHVLFQFEGVGKNAEVYINDTHVGGCRYGYRPFFVCADGLLNPGENRIRVTCENKDQPDSRWYSGAGIYRPVWMWTGPAVSIEPEQIRVDTVSIDPTVIKVHTGCPQAQIEIVENGTVIASANGDDISITIPDAKLWSAETPNLYSCCVSNGEDCAETVFGIRTLSWSNKGVFVNGKEILLKGGCIHHDNGILGAATWDESEYRRAKTMKEAGFNAIRSAHNPTSRAMLEACDKLGLYVMDESWDMWFHHKNVHDYATFWRENYLNDLQAMVDRDYNHPCVIMYSIGNEVSEPAKQEGIQKTAEMVEYLHKADPGRIVTGGFNLAIIHSSKAGKGIYKEEGGMNQDSSQNIGGLDSTVFNLVTYFLGNGMINSANSKAADESTSPSLDLLDVAGYNYASGRYPIEGTKHPNRIVVGSETFPHDLPKNWEMVKKYPYLVGDFMWTSWDYLGEAGIGGWTYEKDERTFSKPYPWLLAEAGSFDILGNPTGEVFLAKAVWGELYGPAIAVRPANHPGVKPAKAAWRGTNSIPSWSWKDCQGNKTVVEVYSDAASVELFLNGKTLGKKKVRKNVASYKVKYTPGELKAVAYNVANQPIGEEKLISADSKLQLQIALEQETASPGQVVYAAVNIVDANGIVESNADTCVKLNVLGGKLLGFGSARPRTEERFETGVYSTYYGHALAAILVEADTELRITAQSDLGEAKAVVCVSSPSENK